MTKVISRVSEFKVDMQAIEAFIKPDVVSVAEARGSPLKRRLSVCGDVIQFEYMETSTCKRRTVKLQGEGTNVDVVLWGESASVSRGLQSGDKVTITAVVNDEDRLTTTLSSYIECSMSENHEKTGLVIAIDDENGFPVEMMLESGEFIKVLEDVYFDYDVQLLVLRLNI